MLVLIVAMMAMIYLYFSSLNKSTGLNNLSTKVLAQNAPMVFTFENDRSFYDILSCQDLFDHILGPDKAEKLSKLRKAVNESSLLTQLVEGKKVGLGFIPIGKDEIDFAFCVELDEAIKEGSLNGSLPTSLKTENAGRFTRISINDSTLAFIAQQDKLLLLTGTTAAMEKIWPKESPKKTAFSTFIEQQTMNSKAGLANLFINFDAFPVFWKYIGIKSLDNELEILTKNKAFVSLNYNFSKEKLRFNGSTNLSLKTGYLSLFSEELPQEIQLTNLLPENTSSYLWYGFNNYTAWSKSLHEWQSKQQNAKKLSSEETAINSKYGINLQDVFQKYVKNQFITFELSTGEKLAAVALNNGEKLGQLLLDLSSEYAPEIRMFKDSGIPFRYFGNAFVRFDRPAFTLIDNYLVMSNYPASLAAFLNAYRNNKLLINTRDYQALKEEMTDANISIYLNQKNAAPNISTRLKTEYVKHFRSKEGLGGFSSFSYQLAADRQNFLTNLLISKPLGSEELKPDSLRR